MTLKVLVAIGSAVGAGTTAIAGTFGMLAEQTGTVGWTLALGISIAVGAAATAFVAILKPSDTP
jgi:hypothetical protein